MNDPAANSDLARRAIALLDLTDLGDNCTAEDIDSLCARAQTPHGPVAAVCVWPRFVARAAGQLDGTPVRIATVVNFPGGGDAMEDVVELVGRAVSDGAGEIDCVLPWRAFLAGEREEPLRLLAAVREACSYPVRLKVILETGELGSGEAIAAASRLAIAGGADFIKTSTGKVPVNATPEAARIMLEVIRDSGEPVGLKPSGGIRTLADCASYLDLAASIMGVDWATPQTFRFGASGVLDALLAELNGKAPASPAGGY